MNLIRKMTRMTTYGAIALLFSAGSLAGHHSLARFDTSAPVWVTGTVVRFDEINPHSRLYLEQETEDGEIRRWTVDGAPLRLLDRMRLDGEVLKAGTVVEVCGFEGLQSQQDFLQAQLDPSTSEIPERFMNGNLLVTPDGKKRVLSDYGVLALCLGPGDEEILIR